MGELGKKLAILSASVMLTLLVSEGAVRLLVPVSFWHPPLSEVWEWLVHDPVRGWKNRPGYANEFFRINSLGMRGADLPRSKPAGVVRVVCLGDSSTFGIWRPEPAELRWDSYTETLAELMVEQAYENVEVVNAGVLGYGSSQGVRQLNLDVLDLDPDIVTVRFGLNDHSTLARHYRIVEPEAPLSRSLFYAFARWRLFHLAILSYQSMDTLQPEPLTGPLTPPERFQNDLERFAEIAASEGFHLLFIDYPLRPVTPGESTGELVAELRLFGAESIEKFHERHERYQAIVRRVASATGTPLLETATSCDATESDCFSDYDLVHPSRVGAELIAGRLFERLQALGWLSPAAPTRSFR